MPVSMWMDFRAVLASNLLEAELRAAFARERQEFDAEVLSRIEWILPDRPLGTELGSALQAGCLRAADLWHVATALYVAPRAEEMGFVTLDGPQREVAAVLGLGSGPAGRLSIPDRATSQARGHGGTDRRALIRQVRGQVLQPERGRRHQGRVTGHSGRASERTALGASTTDAMRADG